MRIPTAHDFCVISARAEKIRDFPQTKLDGEIKPHFLLNEHGDPHFLFYKFNENNIEINATDRDVTGPPERVQICFLKIKIFINNAGYLKPFFLGRR